jgi:hypothetical protein
LGLEEAFTYNGSGVMAGRTWVIAPDPQTLEDRWHALIAEKDPTKKENLFRPHLRNGVPGDKHIRKVPSATLPGVKTSLLSVLNETSGSITTLRYSFRSFDRQWIVADARAINQPNPGLWQAHSNSQIYLTALQRHSPKDGPAISFCANIPDLDHFRGSFGGRVFPLWRDNAATAGNIKATLLAALSVRYSIPVRNDDFFAYLSALLAHPEFTKRFAIDLKQPGIRIPITADSNLFREAVKIGREVVWLHCYGERMVDVAAGRPLGPPRLPKGESPTVPAGHGIPGAPTPLPDSIEYDAAKRRIVIGSGWIENVPKEVWDYEVSGKNVVRQWFSYRRRDRSKPPMGDKRPPSPLESIQATSWLSNYTSELIDLLHVLGRLKKLEPLQADLLERVCKGSLIDRADLASAGALAEPPKVTGGKKKKSDSTLTLL